MSRYWIGLDAGGTGSTLVVTEPDLRVRKIYYGGAIQARKMPLDDQVAVIVDYLSRVEADFGLHSVAGFGLGIAGTGRPDERIAIESALSRLHPNLPCKVVPDSEAAHIGAFAGGDGILVITGTGSIVWGREGSDWHRAGGFGYLIGDEGSGMKLGMEGLSAAGLAWDGGEPTVLCELLEREHGMIDGSIMVKMVYDGGFQPSRIALQVLEAAERGDNVCRAICERQSQLLASQVQIVARKLSTDAHRLVLWGGLQKNAYYNALIHYAIRAAVTDAEFTSPIYEPWVGAALMAKNRTQ